jgi:hypothetical protein
MREKKKLVAGLKDQLKALKMDTAVETRYLAKVRGEEKRWGATGPGSMPHQQLVEMVPVFPSSDAQHP